jgi:hypothetical protein
MDEKIYGHERMADFLGVSGSTFRRMRKGPFGNFIEVSSMSNDGGGNGRAAWSYESSLQNLLELTKAQTSDNHRQNAFKRWHVTECNSGQAW